MVSMGLDDTIIVNIMAWGSLERATGFVWVIRVNYESFDIPLGGQILTHSILAHGEMELLDLIVEHGFTIVHMS